MRKALLLALLSLLLGLPAWAGLITVGTTDPGSIGPWAINTDNAAAVSWYLPNSFSSVDIRIGFEDLSGGATYSAYLMNAIGLGADPSVNEIDNTTFTGSGDLSPVLLWHGLTLDPGFYYLVVGSTDPNSWGGWGATTNPTVTLAPGVLQGDVSGIQYWVSSPDVAAYLPASNWVPDDGSAFGELMYDVSVPEPSTAFLLLGGGLLLAVLRRRR